MSRSHNFRRIDRNHRDCDVLGWFIRLRILLLFYAQRASLDLDVSGLAIDARLILVVFDSLPFQSCQHIRVLFKLNNISRGFGVLGFWGFGVVIII